MAVVWSLSGSLVSPLLLHLPACSALQVEWERRGACLQPNLPPGIHHLHLLGERASNVPSPPPPPSSQPFYGGSGSTRLSVWEEMVVSCLLCKLPLNLFAPSEGRMGAKLGGVLFPLPLISPAPLSVSKVSWKECSPLFFQDLKWPLTTATKGANKKLFSHHKHVCWLSLRAPLG